MRSDIDWIPARLLGAIDHLGIAVTRKRVLESQIAHSDAPAVLDAAFGS